MRLLVRGMVRSATGRCELMKQVLKMYWCLIFLFITNMVVLLVPKRRRNLWRGTLESSGGNTATTCHATRKSLLLMNPDSSVIAWRFLWMPKPVVLSGQQFLMWIWLVAARYIVPFWLLKYVALVSI